jgi:hypothetical protein
MDQLREEKLLPQISPISADFEIGVIGVICGQFFNFQNSI